MQLIFNVSQLIAWEDRLRSD